MKFSEYASKIESFGREVNMDTIVQTRDLITPLIDPDAARGVNIQKDVSYGSDERQRIDVFTPKSGFDEGRPLLIFMHGGGFVAGDKSMPDAPFYENIGIWAVNNGFNAINMTYRLAPVHKWPAGVEDIDCLVQFVKNKGRELGLDGNKVFLMGQSAGGAHCASYVAHPELYSQEGHGLTGLILLSGLYNYTSMPIGDMERSYLGNDESLYAERSSLAGLLKTDLPMLITCSEHDPAFFEAQALELLSALQQRDQKLPNFVHMLGQNHMSVALYLGLTGDLLAPQLKRFINQHSQ